MRHEDEGVMAATSTQAGSGRSRRTGGPRRTPGPAHVGIRSRGSRGLVPCQHAPVPADLVLTGGTVRTGDPYRPTATAVAVTAGLVSGLDDDATAQRGPQSEVVDLNGGALLPSFGDGHAHPLWGGVELAWAPVRDLPSVADTVEAVRVHAAAHPDDPWVLGGSYDPSLSPGGLFDAQWLDAVVPDRPVYLESSDHHCAWVNTVALRLAGITAQTPDPPAATIARRPDGAPLGHEFVTRA